MNSYAPALALISLICTLSVVTACDKAPAPKQPTPAVKAQPNVKVDVNKPLGKPIHAKVSLELGGNKVYIAPIQHGTFYLQWDNKIVYVDPVTPAMLTLPKDQLAPKADIILLTDIHHDHMDADAIMPLLKDNTVIIAPEAVNEQIKDKVKVTHILSNNEEKSIKDTKFAVLTIPMYNIKRTRPKTTTPFHTKGRGNGYIIKHSQGGAIYISGDTECTPEMRKLENIDVAFVTMNLPYTMPVEEAAECIKAFKPKHIVPFHYKGQDVTKLKALLAKTPDIMLHLLEWYPKAKPGAEKTEHAH